MIEIYNAESLFNLPQNPYEAAVITTNGMVNKNGCAIMGKGQALEAANRYPGLSSKLGWYLQVYGNRAFYMGKYRDSGHLISLLTFPTKYHYRDNSNLTLIKASARQVKRITDKFELNKVYLPPVGCGLGRLDYERQVRPVIQEYLDDDRFIVVLGYKNSNGGGICGQST